LAFDSHFDLWGVENSADRLSRSDLGGDALTEDNPAEELNRFKEADIGKNWGYPLCFTVCMLSTIYMFCFVVLCHVYGSIFYDDESNKTAISTIGIQSSRRWIRIGYCLGMAILFGKRTSH